jgi:arylsulfatase A-like enzyme/Flp pilus assembly protein TadD
MSVRRAAILLLIAAAAACGPAERGPARGWNLLLVTIDTLRADRVGVYGSAAGATPTLDELARNGVRFADVTAHTPLTLPSHATILTGLLPTEHGLRLNGVGRLPETVATLATAARGAGYRTGAFVGAFVLARRFGLDRGFVVYDDEVDSPDGAQSFEAERRGDRVVDRALSWLAAPAGESPPPFFLWVHLFDPHTPYAPPSEWRERYPGHPYDAEVAFADHQLGRLRGLLPPKTVVAVAADHGEGLGEHGERTHGLLLYQSTLRVPWVVSAPPLLRSGHVVRDPVGLVDLAPTLAGLLGWSLPGRDLTPAMLDRTPPGPIDLYAETEYPATFGWAPLAALRAGRWKAIVGPSRTDLFDLAADPGETRDAAQSDRRTARSLAERVATRRAEATSSASAPGPLDEETRARLAALGYVAPSGRGSGEGSARDPRDAVGAFSDYELGHDDLLSGRPHAAAERLGPLVEGDPANPVFRAALGRAYSQTGRADQALALLRQAVALAPEDAQAWFNLGTASHQHGRLDEAERALAEAARLDPDWSEPWNGLGLVALRRGDERGAVERFVRATAIDDRSVRAWINLGNSQRALGDRAAAESAFQRALGIDPEAADAANGLGVLRVDAGDPAGAIQWFDLALGHRRGHFDALLNRAVARELAGDPRGAAADYRAYLDATADLNLATLGPQRRRVAQRLARLQPSRRNPPRLEP